MLGNDAEVDPLHMTLMQGNGCIMGTRSNGPQINCRWGDAPLMVSKGNNTASVMSNWCNAMLVMNNRRNSTPVMNNRRNSTRNWANRCRAGDRGGARRLRGVLGFTRLRQ